MEPNVVEIFDQMLKTVVSACDGPIPDGPLYHFTDTAGLIGILSSKSIWLSLATSLNDSSELAYGLDLASSALKSGAIACENLDGSLVAALLTGAERPPVDLSETLYVASFCSEAERALHWLHYGKSGKGVAIGFHPMALSGCELATLFPVVYERDAQHALLEAVVRAVDQGGASEMKRFAGLQGVELSSRMVADWLRSLVIPRLKHPAFAGEAEWRVVATGNLDRLGRFRVVDQRIVPYIEIGLDRSAVAEVVLGASAPIQPDEEPLRLLLKQTIGSVPVRRSSIALRP